MKRMKCMNEHLTFTR